jgi:hypothetical protein
MPTLFEDIYDLFLISVRDFKLDKLSQYSEQNSTNDFETYLQGFLLRSCHHFTNCTKDLTDYVLTPTAQFNQTLSLREQNILADLMVIAWFDKELNDVSQFSLHLSNSDFKTYSEAQNLKEKSERADRLREKISQDMVDYGLLNVDWNSWASGNFYGQ